MTLWRVLLRLSADLHEPGEIQPIDANGFDRRAASRRYTRRTSYTFTRVKNDGPRRLHNEWNPIHCSIKRPYDTQVGEQVHTKSRPERNDHHRQWLRL